MNKVPKNETITEFKTARYVLKIEIRMQLEHSNNGKNVFKQRKTNSRTGGEVSLLVRKL